MGLNLFPTIKQLSFGSFLQKHFMGRVRPERTKPPHTLFYGEDAKYARSLRTFGEMAVVAIHEGKKMRSKLDNRGKTCMFVGYADDHTKDVYRFLNIHTKRIFLSRDMRWLNIMWK